MLTRRGFAGAALGALTVPAAAQAAAKPRLIVYKASGCSCCEGWIKSMWRAGYAPQVIVVDDLSPQWRSRGVPDQLSSCHMGLVGGYVTVGHVPPADVDRLLRERPKAIGVSVPGMPDGSPGMERPDGKTEPYETLLMLPGGKYRVYARH
jgi:hypothetical protein